MSLGNREDDARDEAKPGDLPEPVLSLCSGGEDGFVHVCMASRFT